MKPIFVDYRSMGMEFFKDPAGWLYSEWTEDKYREFKKLYSIPGLDRYIDYLLDLRSDSEYLDRYGMDYTDLHDPRKLKQTSSVKALNSYGLNFVSHNVTRLYR